GISFNAEPAMWVGVIVALLNLAMAFGAPISPDQKAAILGVIDAASVIIGSIVIRQNVTPVASLTQPR
ncbi:MAG: hypothetical protein J2P17_27250, partial [Mycobacterium sp.]|nr:hypothetical protein [Mycobacterium sp.]